MSNPEKTVDIYERLAHALEMLPHGFARTSSGVEIKLMKKAFTPEEVWLAGQLTRTPESADAIAKRVGRDVVEVTPLLEKQGHVHLAFYGFTMFADAPQFMGTCNCCTCCCGVLHGPKLAGLDPSTEGPQKSNYRAVIEPEACIACGECIERCPVDAIAEDENNDNKSVVERATCVGCGVCVIGCPTDAIELMPVSAEEWFHTPSSMAEWEEKRLEYLAAQQK